MHFLIFFSSNMHEHFITTFSRILINGFVVFEVGSSNNFYSSGISIDYFEALFTLNNFTPASAQMQMHFEFYDSIFIQCV